MGGELRCTPGKRGGGGGAERVVFPFSLLVAPRFFLFVNFSPRALLSERLEQAKITKFSYPWCSAAHASRAKERRSIFCHDIRSSLVYSWIMLLISQICIVFSVCIVQ